jgi:DNA-binding protein H-NS
MRTWQYKKVDLNTAPALKDDIDILDTAGQDGWELVTIQPNGVAYFKRQLGDQPAGIKDAAASSNGPDGEATVEEGHGVKAKYRDPATNDTWSGRGRMATWLKRKLNAGKNIDDYLV